MKKCKCPEKDIDPKWEAFRITIVAGVIRIVNNSIMI